MELRDIEIFLTLAEELHFARTAARLHVTPARVSQAIKKQERRIGAPLFDRSNRTVRLTPIGQQLRDDLWPMYTGLQEGMRRAKLAAQGVTAVLRVGLIPLNAHDLRHYWDTFRRNHPQCKLQIRNVPYVDPFAGLRRGDIDVLVAWLPVEEPDLAVGPVLFTEPRVLGVAVDHELTRHATASVEMLADFLHCDTPSRPDYWADSYLPPHTPAGRRIERGHLARSAEEVLSLVTAGEAVNLLPHHVSRYWIRPDITYLPVQDMDRLASGLVWSAEAENDMIRALAQTVQELGPLDVAEL
ncbi:LysR family transcriptional regulator [Streptomyces fodineus]|uniref:LysR family transcriptional regulator n=1 Tax=Streptomyces fodineus TaxID=1904616 RepID=A0A1D7YCL9_9ACTN|nr:LysR family transcriptional regulator [Streptomyces fodineus]AOR33365.1 LysR family transcriptional regulator [Streptomyces fodineus]